ncbi:Gfo/Idh/MocA family oxidoreductase [bacterium]|nr:Gfo/Idh/MocA family oxidoreductase [bacterium]
MKKIGFIDHYIDNFHANKYVELFRQSKYKDKMDVAFAYEEKTQKGLNIDEWCDKHQVTKLSSPEEVVDRADYIMVLSPNNSERHWDLSRDALESGKPTYVDKTFAPDTKTAEKLIELAKGNNTPMFSTSALRYADELTHFINDIKKNTPVTFVSTRGPNDWSVYSIHQVEMIVMLLGTSVRRMMQVGKGKTTAIILDYADNRTAITNCINTRIKIDGTTYIQRFELNAVFGEGVISFPIVSNTFFDKLIDEIGSFFETRTNPVPYEQTIEVMKIIETGNKAIINPFVWINVEE